MTEKEIKKVSHWWTAYYSPRRYEVSIMDFDGNMVFMINAEEVLEAGLDTMTKEQRDAYIQVGYGDIIEEIIESRG